MNCFDSDEQKARFAAETVTNTIDVQSVFRFEEGVSILTIASYFSSRRCILHVATTCILLMSTHRLVIDLRSRQSGASETLALIYS